MILKAWTEMRFPLPSWHWLAVIVYVSVIRKVPLTLEVIVKSYSHSNIYFIPTPVVSWLLPCGAWWKWHNDPACFTGTFAQKRSGDTFVHLWQKVKKTLCYTPRLLFRHCMSNCMSSGLREKCDRILKCKG